MRILHPFSGSVTQYAEEISDPDRHRPGHCPQCEAKQSLNGHGFYCRTLVDLAFDGVIRVRRYLWRICKRTVSIAGVRTALAALRRLRTKLGAPKAITAMAHRLARLVYRMVEVR